MIGFLKVLFVLAVTTPFMVKVVKNFKVVRDDSGKLKDIELPGFARWLLAAIVAFLLSTVVVSAFILVPRGNRGVVFSWGVGVENRVLPEGFSIILPLYERVEAYNIQRSTVLYELGKNNAAASSDIQDVYIDIRVTYRPIPSKANRLWQEVGDRNSFEQKILEVETIQVVKSVIPAYDAQDIIPKREEIREEILERLNKRKALNRYAEVFSVSLRNIEFRTEFRNLLEEKAQKSQELQIAERKVAIAEQDKLKRIKEAEGVAESKKTRADGEAYQNRVLAESVTISSLESRKVDVLETLSAKWNGTFPTTWTNIGADGMPLPLLSINELMQSTINE